MEEFEQIYSEKKRKSLIDRNIKEIKEILADVDSEVLALNQHLIEEAANYAAHIEEMNALIRRDGVVDIYKNGANQWGTKKSVAAEMKPKYTATYQSLIKQLTELLPSEAESDAGMELLDFVNGR